MKRALMVLLIQIFLTTPAVAADDSLVLASGGGYKQMVNSLVTLYTATTGRSVDRMFGNMSRVTTLGRTSGRVDVVLGAEDFLVRAHLDMTRVHTLGLGRLVVACAKGGTFHSPEDLLDSSVTRIAVPDMNQAIYGQAAREYLHAAGVYDMIKEKLVEVATVPQVFSYLASGEVDMGFLNLTHALHVGDALGSYLCVDETMYTPINTVLAELRDAPHKKAAADFYAFLDTEEARKIIAANGL